MALLAAALLVVIVVTVRTGRRPVTPSLSAGNAPHGASPDARRDETDSGKIIGRWVRPDGGYVLDIRGVAENGDLDAAYLNPRPINVAVARASQAHGAVQVFVELRDVNYPGSTYALEYDPATDRLVGSYYQAVDKVTYQILFVRAR
jgi:hypothetical protein